MGGERVVPVCLFLVFLSGATGLHTGAPAEACDTMIPGHGVSPKTGKSPYRIIMPKMESNGEPLEITLTAATSGPPFKGFFIQIREKGGNAAVGEFDPNSQPADAQAVNCGGKTNVAMTHKDNNPKTQVKLQWTPHPGANGEFEPWVTFVQQQDTFWVKETSDKPIKVSGSGSGSGSKGNNASEDVAGRSGGGASESAGADKKAQSNESGSGEGQQGGGASDLIPYSSAILITSLIALRRAYFLH